ncbi:MAG: aldehyde dehydrogenase [Chitinophagaceae bacterium]|nr:MAG: aldehyde dehydrogenase [Chitinophagaceae bacterium]
MDNLPRQLQACRQLFSTGITKSYEWRIARLQRLKAALLAHEEDIYTALATDLKKGKEEVWVTETGFALTELNKTISHLKKWMRPRRIPTNLLNLPSSSRVYKEPLGTVLIIGPWNYPLQLLLTPLIGALAAGNTVVVKPSEFAPATAAVISSIIGDAFDPSEVLFVEGDGATVIPSMMEQFVFNHIFYTGSTAVGRIIYQAAARDLIPVTLELGGKSPCIIEDDANIEVAARRIMMTKFSNAGQMCVAPDYILVHSSRKELFIRECKKALLAFFGDNPQASSEYGKIINEKQFDRLAGYLSQGTAVTGGGSDRASLYIAPTLLDNVSPASPLMKEEIFGPLLPLISFEERSEAESIIALNPDPLAFYIFTSSRSNEKYWISRIPFGGGCVNNAALHLTNPSLPFGGRGASGIGKYHGRYSFDTFSHEKGVMRTPTWLDPSIKYPPFKGRLNLFRKLIR